MAGSRHALIPRSKGQHAVKVTRLSLNSTGAVFWWQTSYGTCQTRTLTTFRPSRHVKMVWSATNMSSRSGVCHACAIWRTTRQTDKLKTASSSLYKDTTRKLLLWNLVFIKFTAGVGMHVDITALVSSWLQSRRTCTIRSRQVQLGRSAGS